MKKNIKSLLCAGMVLGLGAALLGGCSSNGGSGSQTAVTAGESSPEAAKTETGEQIVLTYWHTDASDNIVRPLEKLIADYQTENPNIKIEFLALPADSFYQKYVTAIATNTAPDIFGVRDTELLPLVNQNGLLAIDDYVENWEQKDNLSQMIWDSVKFYTEDGKIYMVPSYMNTSIMWYNTKRMEELGIEIPKTQAEFLANCEKYANPAENSYFYTLRGGVGSFDNMFMFLMTYAGGNNFFDEEGNCVLDQDIYAEALDIYAGIYKNGWVSRDSITNAYKEMVSEFGSGITMSLMHNSSSETNHVENLGRGSFTNAIPPVGANGKAAIPVPALIGTSVSKQSKHPEEAAKFVMYLAENTAASYFCENAGKTPVNDLVYKDTWCQENETMDLYTEVMNSDKVTLYNNPIWLTQWPTFYGQDVLTDFQAVLLDEKDSKTVLASWAEKLTSYQKEYLEKTGN